MATVALAAGVTVNVLSSGGRSATGGPAFVPGRAAVATPRQQAGSAKGRAHRVPASVTAADRVKGAPPAPREGSAGTSGLPPAPRGTVSGQQFQRPGAPARSRVPSREQGVATSNTAQPATRKVTGFEPGESTLLPASAGQAFARVYSNPDGTQTADVFQQPVNYRTSAGRWARINSTLKRTSSGWRIAADNFTELFAAAGGAARLVTLGFGSRRTISFGVAGARPVRGRVSGESVTYPGIHPGAALTMTTLPGGGAKESITLWSPDAPATWTFPLQLRGLAPSLDGAGRVIFRDGSGQIVAWMPHAFMTDSAIGAHSGIGAYSAGATYTLTRVGPGRWLLGLTLDRAWLDDPARVFPVIVDPTALNNYDDTEDTFVQTGYSTTNDASAELRIGTYDGGSDYAATYLDFSELSSTLSHDTIYGATLYLAENWSFSCTAEPVGVYKVTQSWDPAKIAAYPGPSYSATALGAASFAAGYSGCPTPVWEHIGLGSAGTALVQSWADGGANYGLAVGAPTAGQTSCSTSYPTVDCGWKKFDSNNTVDAPYLAVTYSPYNASYAFAASPPTVSPAVLNNRAGYVDVKVTNKGHDTWTASNGYVLLSDVYKSGTQTQVVPVGAHTYMPSNVAPGQTVTVHMKIDPLPPGSYDIYPDMIYVYSGGTALFSDWGVPRNAKMTVTVPAIPPNLTAMYPQNNYQVGTLTPQLFAAATTVDAWPSSTVNYQFQICAGQPGAFTSCTPSPWQAGQVWQVPGGHLSWDTDYYWTVQGRDAGGDGTQPSTTGPWHLLQTAVQQPVITSHLAAGSAAAGSLNPVMGNYSSSVTDARVATAGPALAITRRYNSLDPRASGLFGAGWSTVYDMAVTPDGGGTGSVVVTLADGTQVRFAQNSDGSYSPQQGIFATLISVGNGSWELRDKSSTVYIFNPAGQLTSISDNRGRAETLAYDSSSPPQLTTITSASGRSLHLTLSGGHVTSVATDPVGGSPLTWTYSYSGNELTRVCAPQAAPNCTAYAYTSGSHLQSALTDSGPVGFWPLADTSGTTAASAVGANLGADKGMYLAGATPGQDAGPGAGSNATAARFAGSGAVQLPPSALTELGPFLSLEAWFKTTSDGVIVGYQDQPITGTPVKWTPALYVGTDGKLRAEFWHGQATPITSAAAVSDGRWHQALLSSNGSTQSLYLDGHLIGTVAGTIVDDAMDYTVIGDGFTSSGWPAATSANQNFGFTGDIADVAVYDTPLGAAAATAHWQTSQAAAELSQITLPSGRSQVQVSYNTVTDRVATETDSGGGTWTLGGLGYAGTAGTVTAAAALTDPRHGTITSVYDPLRGYQLTSQTDQSGGTTTWSYNTAGFADSTTNPDGSTTNNTVDARGNITSQSAQRASGQWFTNYYTYYLDTASAFDPRNDRMTSDADGRSASAADSTYRTSWAYDAYGDVTAEQLPATPGYPAGRSLSWTYTAGTEPAAGGGTEPPGLPSTRTDPANGKTSYAYDAAGDLTSQTDPNGLVTTWTYDALGRKTSMTKAGVTTAYTYDGVGRLLTQTGPAAANLVTGATHTQKITSTYDGDGNLLTATAADTTGGDTARTTTRTYNTHGQLASITDPAGSVTSYTYDAAGNIATQTDPDGVTYSFTYTPAGQQATKSLLNWAGNPDDPSSPATLLLNSRAYDPAGQLASDTDSMGRTTSYTYYLDGLQATVTATGALLNGSTTPASVILHAYTYDGAGNLVQDVANGGLTTTNYARDAASQLTSSTLDPAGLDRVTSYGYDADSNLTSVIQTGTGSSGSRETANVYDPAGYLTRQTVHDGGQNLVTTYTVDVLGHVLSVTDPRGNVTGATAGNYTTTMTYDANGNLQTATSPPVQVTQNGAAPATAQPAAAYGYDTFGDRTQVQAPSGKVTTTAYNGDGMPTTVTQPSYTPPGGKAVTPVTTTSYDPDGNTISYTDAAGSKWTNTYDQLGNLVKTTNPAVGGASGSWTYGYDTDGEQTSAVSPTGAQAQATYDSLGHQITATQVERYPASAAYTTKMTYDPAGDLLASTDPAGNTATYTYNAAGAVTRSTDPLGHTTTSSYNGFGDLATVTNPLGDTTTASYDPAGRKTSLAQADSTGTTLATTSYGYDPAGNQTTVTNPDGNTTSLAYDAVNQLSSATTPITATASDTVSYGYDSDGNRTLVTDGNGSSTVTTYNTLSLPESVILPATTAHPDPASRTFTISYDADSRPVSETEPGGITRAWGYDALGDLTSQSGSGAAATTPSRTLGYNLAGQLTSYTTPGGTTSVSYDDRGLPIAQSGGGQPAQSSTYDATGRLATRTDATGTASFSYNPAGQLTTMTDPLTSATLTLGYDNAGELTSTSYGTGADARAFGYDALGRITSDTLATSSGTTIASATYAYDSAGNLTSQKTSGTAGAGTSTYTYDQAGWLTSWKNPAGATTSYGYDNAGNLTTAGNATSTYNQQNQLTSTTSPAGTTTYSYTPSGTLSQVSGPAGTTPYAFDAYGNMTTAGSISYAYDALGRLDQRTDSQGATTLAYDGTAALTPAAILGTSGQLQQAYSRDPAGNLISAAAGGTAAIAWTDPLHGDVTGLLAPASTSLQSSAAYDPWGNITATTGTMPALGYQGSYTDPATGLVDMGARWYNPTNGAFTTADTLATVPGPGSGSPPTAGNPQAGNGPGPYGYANDNPLTTTDPTGHLVQPITEGGGGLSAAQIAANIDGLITNPEFFSGPELTEEETLARAKPWNYIFGITGPVTPTIEFGLVSSPCATNISACLGSQYGPISWPIATNSTSGGNPGSASPDQPTGPGRSAQACGLECQLEKIIYQNEHTVLAKPHETPGITQAQLDKRREAIEAKDKAVTANENLTGISIQFKGTDASSAPKTAPSGKGGPPGSGPPPPPTPGCQAEPAPQDPNAAEDSNSSILRKNLEATGQFGEGFQAHHIVPGGSYGGNANLAAARKILKQFGIGINDAPNGTYLPAGFHQSVHIQSYFQALNDALSGANSADDVQAVLRTFANQLQNNVTFNPKSGNQPWC
ncbi:MAG: AHH domain-containing protein [Actinobacteria bacterium]|nr:AHH domain-containing protein [Actinomycetota bacterium]